MELAVASPHTPSPPTACDKDETAPFGSARLQFRLETFPTPNAATTFSTSIPPVIFLRWFLPPAFSPPASAHLNVAYIGRPCYPAVDKQCVVYGPLRRLFRSAFLYRHPLIRTSRPPALSPPLSFQAGKLIPMIPRNVAPLSQTVPP